MSILDATFSEVALADGSDPDDSAKKACLESVTKAQDMFSKLAEKDGHSDRSALLALLELEKRSQSYGLSTGSLYVFMAYSEN